MFDLVERNREKEGQRNDKGRVKSQKQKEKRV